MPFELRTQRLLLRDVNAADYEALRAWDSDPDVIRYMDWGPNSEADTRDFIARAE
jgi:ribosomal-protein-alanine N-acetyltransferase